MLGTPTEESWPNHQLLPNFIAFEPRESITTKDEFGYIHKSNATNVFMNYSHEFDLVFKLLVLDPKKRLSAVQVRSTYETTLMVISINAPVNLVLHIPIYGNIYDSMLHLASITAIHLYTYLSIYLSIY